MQFILDNPGMEGFSQEEWTVLPSEAIKSFIHNDHRRLHTVTDVKEDDNSIKNLMCKLLIRVICVVSVVMMI